MAEHQIRFRAGWEVEPRHGFDMSRRITLPIKWPERLEGAIHLIRRFGRPRSLAENEAILIELNRVPGLLGIQWNGTKLTVAAVDPTNFRLTLVEPLAERNILELDVDLSIARRAESWGVISLIVVSSE